MSSVNSEGRLAGKVAIVTGAGQTPGDRIGNGRATAVAFAREGASVLIVDRDEAQAAEALEQVRGEGGTAEMALGDVAEPADCESFVKAAVDGLGGLDIVHHNVGIGLGDGWLPTVEIDNWERIMRVNAGGAMLMARAAMPVLEAQGSGVITNVSSIASLVAGIAPGTNAPLAYRMSKSAMNSLTLALAQTGAPHGVRVNAILPGLMDTPMAIEAVVDEYNIPKDKYVAARNKIVPLKGGMGTAWDVANAAVFLASEEARFITGVLLPVDGGQSARIG